MRLFSYIIKSRFGKTIIGIPLLFLCWLLLIGSDDRPGFLRAKTFAFLTQIQATGSTTTVNAYGNWVFDNVPTGVGAGGWTDDGTVVRLATATDDVSIGTAVATAKLSIIETTEQLRLGYDATNYMTFVQLADGHTTIATEDPDGVEADININPDGNVGIKTAAPSVALEVTGAITLSGVLKADDLIDGNGTSTTGENTLDDSLFVVGSVVAVGTATDLDALPKLSAKFAGDDDLAFQIHAYDHDNIAIIFDGYHNGTGFISSDAGSNYAIYKTGDKLSIRADVAAKGAAMTLVDVWNVNNIGAVQQDNNLIIGNAGAGVDFTITFDGQNSDGVITHMEDENRIDFSGSISSNGTFNFAADSQGDDDYEIAISSITALTTGLSVTFTANTANTDGATLEITSVGDIDALVIAEAASVATALATGEILAGQVVTAVFDGTNWQVTSRLANDRN